MLTCYICNWTLLSFGRAPIGASLQENGTTILRPTRAAEQAGPPDEDDILQLAGPCVDLRSSIVLFAETDRIGAVAPGPYYHSLIWNELWRPGVLE